MTPISTILIGVIFDSNQSKFVFCMYVYIFFLVVFFTPFYPFLPFIICIIVVALLLLYFLALSEVLCQIFSEIKVPTAVHIGACRRGTTVWWRKWTGRSGCSGTGTATHRARAATKACSPPPTAMLCHPPPQIQAHISFYLCDRLFFVSFDPGLRLKHNPTTFKINIKYQCQPNHIYEVPKEIFSDRTTHLCLFSWSVARFDGSHF